MHRETRHVRFLLACIPCVGYAAVVFQARAAPADLGQRMRQAEVSSSPGSFFFSMVELVPRGSLVRQGYSVSPSC